MHRRLNLRVLLYSLTSLVVLAGVVHVVHAVQSRRNASALLRQAERAVEDKQLLKAAGYFHHYLAYEPEDTEALAKYALALDKLEPTFETRFRIVLLVEQVLRRDPNRHDLRRRLVQIEIELARFSGAIRNLEILVAAHPRESQLEHQLAWCQEAAGDFTQSAASFARAIAFAPAQLESYSLLSELYQDRLERPDEAARVMDEMVQANPKSPQALLLRARQLQARTLLDEAAADIERARELAPQNAEVLLSAAELARRRGRFDQARIYLRSALAAQPDGEGLYLALAALELEAGQRAQAVAALEQGLEQTKGAASLVFRLTDLLCADGKSAAAEKLWRDLSIRQPRDMRSRFHLFELALQRDQEAEANALLAEIRRLETADDVLGPVGQALIAVRQARRGDRSQLSSARKLIREAGKRDRTWARIPLLEAELAELSGQPEQAIEPYLRAVALGEVSAFLAQRAVSLLVERRRFNDADTVLRALEARQPLPPQLVKQAAETALANQDTERAVRLARHAVAPGSRDYRDYLWLAELLRGADRMDEAESTLRDGLKIAPLIPDVWVALVRHLTYADQRTQAREILTQAQAKLPPDRAALALARCHEILGQLDEAQHIYAQALAERPRDFVLLRAAAEYHLRADDFRLAEPLLRRLIDPVAVAPLEFVAEARRQLAFGLGMAETVVGFQAAQALLDQNLEQRGNSIEDDRARLTLLAMRSASRTDALRRFEAASPRQPLTAQEQFWLVQLYAMHGDRARALELLDKLLTADIHNPQYLASRIRSLIHLEAVEDARLDLERLERLEPASGRTRELRVLFKKLQESR